jgi:hypothetical protein
MEFITSAKLDARIAAVTPPKNILVVKGKTNCWELYKKTPTAYINLNGFKNRNVLKK